jgi:putative tryptophan/tyrosine transport system substrate-binding protein
MRRRDFIRLAGGSAAAWPLAARGQQRERMQRASVLMSYVESDTGAQKWAKAFDESLQELGWNNGRNIQLAYRWPGPNPDRLRSDAEELVRLSPDILLAGATPAVIALQHATRPIPIVFGSAGVGNEGMDAAPTRKALSRLTGVLRIKAVFRAHLGDDRKILAASDQTDDG